MMRKWVGLGVLHGNQSAVSTSDDLPRLIDFPAFSRLTYYYLPADMVL